MAPVSVMEHGGPIGIFKGQPDQTQGAAANKYCSLPKSHEHTADSYPGDDGRDANRPEATFEALLFQLFFVFLPMLTYPSKRHCEKLNVPVNLASSVFIIFQTPSFISIRKLHIERIYLFIFLFLSYLKICIPEKKSWSKTSLNTERMQN